MIKGFLMLSSTTNLYGSAMATYSSASVIKPKRWEEFKKVVCSAGKRWSNVSERQAGAGQILAGLCREIQRAAAGVDSVEIFSAQSGISGVQP